MWKFFFVMIEKYVLPAYTIYKGKQTKLMFYSGKFHEIPAKNLFFHEIRGKFFLGVIEKKITT